jgi:hypothetical protein
LSTVITVDTGLPCYAAGSACTTDTTRSTCAARDTEGTISTDTSGSAVSKQSEQPSSTAIGTVPTGLTAHYCVAACPPDTPVTPEQTAFSAVTTRCASATGSAGTPITNPTRLPAASPDTADASGGTVTQNGACSTASARAARSDQPGCSTFPAQTAVTTGLSRRARRASTAMPTGTTIALHRKQPSGTARPTIAPGAPGYRCSCAVPAHAAIAAEETATAAITARGAGNTSTPVPAIAKPARSSTVAATVAVAAVTE